MNDRPLRRASALAVAVVGLTVSGCGSSPGSPSVSSPSPSMQGTPTPQSSASSASPSFSGEDAAVRRLIGQTLYETQDAVASDYTVELNALHQVMTGKLVDERLQLYAKYRSAGQKQTGHIAAEVLSVSTVGKTHVVRACVDTSRMDVVDKTGASVMWKDSPHRVLHEFEVVNDRGAYKAASDKSVAASC